MLEELKKQGWTVRFIADEPRLSEAVEQYKASGFEVLVEHMSKDVPCGECAGEGTENQCRVCFNGYEDRYKMILTRPAKAQNKVEEDLF
jgi:hypothetical protein